MLMSVIKGALSAPQYPELAGKRVLITGLSESCGVDIVRAFAEHRTRLILQFSETSERTQTIAEIAAPSVLDIEVFGPVGTEAEDVVQFGRTVAQAFGGLDAVINLVPLSPARLDASATAADVERQVAERLLVACLLTKIVGNRMTLTLTDGLILNVATMAQPACRLEQAFAMVARSALAAMTRAQAQEWANRGIRLNAIAPQTTPPGQAEPALSGEPDIAALALYLASGRGRALSGHVFEAEPRRQPDGRFAPSQRASG